MAPHALNQESVAELLPQGIEASRIAKAVFNLPGVPPYKFLWPHELPPKRKRPARQKSRAKIDSVRPWPDQHHSPHTANTRFLKGVNWKTTDFQGDFTKRRVFAGVNQRCQVGTRPSSRAGHQDVCFTSAAKYRSWVSVITKAHTVDGRNPAPPEKPGNHDFPVNTNKQWFPMVS